MNFSPFFLCLMVIFFQEVCKAIFLPSHGLGEGVKIYTPDLLC